jgi:transcription-repair coupling factor (superfamily II helicase)
LTVEELLSRYEHHAALPGLMSRESGSRAHLLGSSGSQHALLFAAAFRKDKHTMLAVLPEKEEAAYFLNDLEHLLPEQEILFFPAASRKVYDPETSDPNQKLLRAEVLNRLHTSTQPIIVVSFTEALMEKVVSHGTLRNNTFK